jgi:spoIIIJ-associated protein
MPIDDLQQAAQKIAGFLANLNKLGGLRLKYRISAGASAAVADAADGANAERSVLNVELAGPDVPLVTQHNGELLRALETISAQILRLDQREGDLVSFDAGNFKALQLAELKQRAEIAAEKVIRTGVPYAFPPTNSRERRQLHMAFKDIEGVETASSGEGQDRFLAVYPAGKTHLPVTPPVKPPAHSRGFERRR